MKVHEVLFVAILYWALFIPALLLCGWTGGSPIQQGQAYAWSEGWAHAPPAYKFTSRQVYESNYANNSEQATSLYKVCSAVCWQERVHVNAQQIMPFTIATSYAPIGSVHRQKNNSG